MSCQLYIPLANTQRFLFTLITLHLRAKFPWKTRENNRNRYLLYVLLLPCFRTRVHACCLSLFLSRTLTALSLSLCSLSQALSFSLSLSLKLFLSLFPIPESPSLSPFLSISVISSSLLFLLLPRKCPNRLAVRVSSLSRILTMGFGAQSCSWTGCHEQEGFRIWKIGLLFQWHFRKQKDFPTSWSYSSLPLHYKCMSEILFSHVNFYYHR